MEPVRIASMVSSASVSEDRRSHARVAVEIPCTLSGPAGDTEAVMQDISAVGARVVSPTLVADDYEELELSVESDGASEGIRVKARVMYHRSRAEGIAAGIQFIEMDAATHRSVTGFLAAVLAGEGGGAREHPRVSRRIDVVCLTKTRARAMLEDISRGGIRVMLEDGTAEPGDQIEVIVTIGKLDRPLSLQGAIVRTKLDEEGHCHAGVRISALTPATEALVAHLLKALVAG